MRPILVLFYGLHNATIDQRLRYAKPLFLVSNTPAGPWRGNCNAGSFAAVGIRVFSYIEGGYEGTLVRDGGVPVDLAANMAFIDDIAQEPGVHGIFLNQVSSAPEMFAIEYLEWISDRCRQYGLQLICNVGVSEWASSLMSFCDYVVSNLMWAGESPSQSQLNWTSQTMLVSQQVADHIVAAQLTNQAHAGGYAAHHAGPVSTSSLPAWFDVYVAAVPVLP